MKSCKFHRSKRLFESSLTIQLTYAPVSYLMWWGLQIDSVQTMSIWVKNCELWMESTLFSCTLICSACSVCAFVHWMQFLRPYYLHALLCATILLAFISLGPKASAPKKIEQNHLIIVCSEKKKLLFRRINTPIFSTESFLFCFLAQWLKIESFTHSLTKFKRE